MTDKFEITQNYGTWTASTSLCFINGPDECHRQGGLPHMKPSHWTVELENGATYMNAWCHTCWESTYHTCARQFEVTREQWDETLQMIQVMTG